MISSYQTFQEGDILKFSPDGVRVCIIRVEKPSFSFDIGVEGTIIYTTEKKGFWDFACQEKLLIQVLKKHCVKL